MIIPDQDPAIRRISGFITQSVTHIKEEARRVGMNSRISDDHHEANLRKVVHAVEVHRGDVDGLAGLHGGPLRAQRQLRRVLTALHLYTNQSSAMDPDPYWILIQGGPWIRIQEGKNDPQTL
jgi:hypothetical protein